MLRVGPCVVKTQPLGKREKVVPDITVLNLRFHDLLIPVILWWHQKDVGLQQSPPAFDQVICVFNSQG
jgi:hypothetical protein